MRPRLPNLVAPGSCLTLVFCTGCYRSDGRLVVAGCKDSTVKVFDEKSKTVLRFYKGHKAYVWSSVGQIATLC